jgi:hypothetical protein
MENKMDTKMDENKEEILKYIKELKNSLSSMIFHSLYDRLPKGYIKMQGTHEKKVVFTLNNLPIISNFQVDLTLIMELIMAGVLN